MASVPVAARRALEALRKLGARGNNHVLDADIRDFFGSLDHERMERLLSRRISDRRVLRLLRLWLRAGVMEDGVRRSEVTGAPQGGVISPLLSNIYLHVLDETWHRSCSHQVRAKVHVLTGRRWNWVKDIRELIARLNPILRGWGNYFRTGNAAKKFNQLDTYVWSRLRRFLVKRQGRHLRAGQVEMWSRDFFHGHGLHRLRGTVRYPEAA